MKRPRKKESKWDLAPWARAAEAVLRARDKVDHPLDLRAITTVRVERNASQPSP